MKRRDFFGRLIPAAAGAAIVAPKVAEAISADLPDHIVKDGIEAKWLGWKRPVDMDRTWGVWLFILPTGKMSYSTSGGVIHRDHGEGYVMDMRHHGDLVKWLSSTATEEELRVERTNAYERGIKDATAWMQEPKPKEPEWEMTWTGLDYATGRKCLDGIRKFED